MKLDPPSAAPSPHWMLREIDGQPGTLAATLDRYIEGSALRDVVCRPARDWLKSVQRDIVIAASGSSRHAGLAAESMFEDLSGIAVHVEYASEYCCQSGKALKDAMVMFVSQSGETADTLAALRKATAAGHLTLAITNAANSNIACEATVSFPTEAGIERAIPATKSFTAQLLNLYLLSLLAAEACQAIPPSELQARLVELRELPARIERQLKNWKDAVQAVAARYRMANNFLFLGRGVHYAVAREGVLKLKEPAYLHAEGYPSGELRHGPNALVSDGTPLVMIATVDRSNRESIDRYRKVVHLMQAMREQGADIFAVANPGDELVGSLATNVVWVEETQEALSPITEIIPRQLFAYFMAVERKIDVDCPRNLNESGTRRMNRGMEEQSYVKRQDVQHYSAICLMSSLTILRRSRHLVLFLLLGTLFNTVARSEEPGFRVGSLEIEGQTSPLGIDVVAPHFLWKLADEGQDRGLTQESYRILVASTPDLLHQDRGDVWDSGVVRGRATFGIRFGGKPLTPHRRYFWKAAVKVNGTPPVWSESAEFVTGMLHPYDWKAKWIAASKPYQPNSPLPLFRREFSLHKPITSALVMVSGLGQYELRVNGNPVTYTVLNPAWTDYRKTIFYNTFDITRQIQQGANAFAVLLGNGMYNVEEVPGRYAKFTGSFGEPKLILQCYIALYRRNL
jgi:glucosamine--fructose-6-phosphate aminotransferase (isomerizing)